MRMLAVLLALVNSYAAEDHTISGTVVDHLTNRPLKQVLVEIAKVGNGGGEASVVTEADGRFVFLHVPRGKYNLQAQKRGQNPVAFRAGSDGFATALVVDGRLKTDDIIFPLRSDSAISVTVLGDDGEPVRNAQVHLLHEAVFDGVAQIINENSTSTNSGGKFHFGHLDAGKYYLAAAGKPWYEQPGAESVYPVTFYGDTTEVNAARSITLAEGASVNVQIEIHAVPAIHVRVLTKGQGFQLSVPGPGSTQIPIPTAMNFANGEQTSAESGEAMNAELTDISAGRYEFMRLGEHGEPSMPTVLDLTNGSTFSLDMPTAKASISGRIIFDSPQTTGESHIYLIGGRQVAGTVVAADGNFKFENVLAGTFDINLNLPSLVVTSLQAKGARVVHERLEIAAGATVEVTIHAQDAEALAKVEGFASHGETGVAGAMLLLLPQALDRVALIRRDQSDADGSFSLTGVLPGRYTLIAIDDGHDLAYKNEKTIKPYLAGGLSITVPLKSNEPVKVPVQTRKL